MAEYADWARHFGKATTDPELVAEFNAAGIAKIPIRARDDVHTSEDVGALTVNLFDPLFLGIELKLPKGASILAGIAIHLGDLGERTYSGQLPYSLEADDTQTSLRQKLGEPRKSNDRRRWDSWLIDGLKVTAKYSEGFERLESVAVFIPERDAE